MSIKAALERAGISAPEAEFGVAVARYLSTGGTAARAHELIDLAAQKLRGGGQFGGAPQGRETPAPASQPSHSGAGQVRKAPTGRDSFARPACEPSNAYRAIAMQESQKFAQTILDTRKTFGGTPWGDVGMHELDYLGRDGAIARAIRDRVGPLSNSQRFKTVRELIKPEEFAKIWEANHAQS